MFNVGDKVKVTDDGAQYTSYINWFNLYAPEYINQWKTCFVVKRKNEILTIVAKGAHHDDSIDPKMCYLLSDGIHVHLFSEYGLALEEKAVAPEKPFMDQIQSILFT